MISSYETKLKNPPIFRLFLMGKDTIKLGTHTVHGLQIDMQTGCEHYRSPLDLIAIKFKCCSAYYSCYFCHSALTDHPVERWRLEEVHMKAILCGQCGIEMTIREYLMCRSTCVHCQAQLNPGCRQHWGLYFDLNLETAIEDGELTNL